MADVYYDTGGSNTAPHETWAKAATTLATAVAQLAAGDRLLMASNPTTTETPGTTTYTFPGTDASPNEAITSLIGSAPPTYQVAQKILVDISGTGDMSLEGHARIAGVSFRAGDDLFVGANGDHMQVDYSRLEVDRNTGDIRCAGGDGSLVTMLETTLVLSDGSNTNQLSISDGASFQMTGGSIETSGQTGNLFSGPGTGYDIVLRGVDIPSFTGTILEGPGAAARLTAKIINCEVNDSLTAYVGTILSSQSIVEVIITDDTAGGTFNEELTTFFGTLIAVTDALMTGGASDGTQAISYKMVTTGDALEARNSLYTPWEYGWHDGTSSVTFKMNIVWDGGAGSDDLQDDEIWLEVQFLDTSGSTLIGVTTDRLLTNRLAEADTLATPVDQTNNSETWTGSAITAMTNAIKHQVSVTVTPAKVGRFRCRVHLAKPSTTIYVDPLVVIS